MKEVTEGDKEEDGEIVEKGDGALGATLGMLLWKRRKEKKNALEIRMTDIFLNR